MFVGMEIRWNGLGTDKLHTFKVVVVHLSKALQLEQVHSTKKIH